MLSIDVGSKNMVFCKVEYVHMEPFFYIKSWDFVNCHGHSNIQLTVEKCVSTMREDTGIMDAVDEIVIETQPTRNIKMKVLSHCLQTFFLLHDKKVSFADPKAKLKMCEPCVSKRTYAQNKKASVNACTLIMMKYAQYHPDDDFVKLYMTSKKKDDLADALLQALVRMNYPNPYTCNTLDDHWKQQKTNKL